MHIRILITIVIFAVSDLYVFQAVKTVTARLKKKWRLILRWSYWIIDIVLVGITIYFVATGKFGMNHSKSVSYLIGLMFVSLVPKLIITPILIAEDLFRILKAFVNFLINIFRSNSTRHKPLMEERRKFVSQIAIGVAAIPFVGLIHGMVIGKYNYKIHRVNLLFKDIPSAFDNFTITQLSDIHCGSFDDANEVARGIKLANSLNSDILFFTGDFVNNLAKEMEPWMDIFSKLRAPFGKFSILGNHDYGDYSRWKSKEAKVRNLERLKTIQKELGFRLLLNENLKIEKEGQSISLIGVENWGKRGFARYGDLNKALAGVDEKSFKILLSHDPSHWDAEILKHEQHIHLTLSGHTHGMQFGVEIPGFKWSPVQYFYPEWAGLYEKQNKFLYVNRGFGFIGYPGRVGIYPEITVITLQKA